jgi:hypothetical protein
LMTFAIRGGCSVLGGFVNILTANAGNVEVQGGGAVWAAGGHDLHEPKHWESTVLGHPGTVHRLQPAGRPIYTW